MISSLTALLIVFAAVIGSTAMIAILAYFLNRIRRIETGFADAAGSRQLADDVAGIREELLAVQDDMSTLSERLDFTERLLMQGDEATTAGDSESLG